MVRFVFRRCRSFWVGGRGMSKERTVLTTREHAIAAAQNSVRNQGYAVAVHGSRVRDLDLIAIPWQDTALTARQVAEIIAASIPGHIESGPEKKPHGRIAYTIRPHFQWGFDRWYIDLSVMPRRRSRASGLGDAE